MKKQTELPAEGLEEEPTVEEPMAAQAQTTGTPVSDDELEQVTGGVATNWNFDW